MAPEGTRDACQAAQAEALSRTARVVNAVTLAIWSSTSLPLDLNCQTKSDLGCRLQALDREVSRSAFQRPRGLGVAEVLEVVLERTPQELGAVGRAPSSPGIVHQLHD